MHNLLKKYLLMILVFLTLKPVLANENDSKKNINNSSANILGIWTTPAELAAKPMSGPAWERVMDGAQKNTSDPDLDDQNDHTGVFVLAAAIVATRLEIAEDPVAETYRNKAISTIEYLMRKGFPGGRTLAWGRNISAYVMAADLLGYRTPEFESYANDVADVWRGSQITNPYNSDEKATLRQMFEKRPNNWGAHAFASLAAIYWYLGKKKELTAIRDYWIQAINGPKPSGLDYGRGNSYGWHLDDDDPRWINPKNAVKCNIDIDGIIPDDMDRGAPFSCDRDEAEFVKTGYAWEGLQGLVVAGRIFERSGLAIWAVGDSAIYRAGYKLQIHLGGLNSDWRATSNNDGWLLVFLDDAYGTNWASSLDNSPTVKWGYGRGAGWGYVLNDTESDPVGLAPSDSLRISP